MKTTGWRFSVFSACPAKALATADELCGLILRALVPSWLILNFGHLNLFRISEFVIRIYLAYSSTHLRIYSLTN